MRKRKLKSVNLTWFGISFFTVTILYLVVALLVIQYRFNEMQDQYETRAVQTAEGYANVLSTGDRARNYIGELLEEQIATASGAVFLRDQPFNEALLSDYAEQFDVDEIYIYDEDGMVTHSSNGEFIGWEAPEGHPIRDFIQSGEETYVESVREDSERGFLMKFGYTRLDDGRFSQIGIRAERLQSFTDSFEARRMFEGIEETQAVEGAAIIRGGELTYVSDDETRDVILSFDLFEGRQIGEGNWTAAEDMLLVAAVPIPDARYGHEGHVAVVKTMDAFYFEMQFMVFSVSLIYASFLFVISTIFVSLYRKTKSHFDLAYFDPLTGLPNATYLKEYVKELKEDPGASPSAFLMINIRNFRAINLSKGYTVGDETLKLISHALNRRVGDAEMLFRFNSDRFIVIREDGSDDQRLLDDARQLIEEVSAHLEPIVESFPVKLQAAILAGNHRLADAEDIYRRLALTLDKIATDANQSILFFDADLEADYQRIELLKQELRGVVDGTNRESLYYHFQPQVRLDTGKLSGFEVLARFHSETYGEIRPDEFIRLAEENQLITDLGDRILIDAVSMARDIMDASKAVYPLAVNLSVIQLYRPDFTAFAVALCEDYGIPRSMIEFEVTESVFTDLFDEKPILQLQELKDAGFSISMDDFGKGYSSFSRLRDLPVNRLKIDKAFIWELDATNTEESLLEDIISMCHKMGLDVVGEGIETDYQQNYLKQLGCDLGQGFYFSRPVDREKALGMVKEGYSR
ncbi:putative bifunctional diguanylate cyclase/phosphodiesterase [Salisediminibacterium selenitireducens]|uniref:Diguanylate cyclase/phosphodiesterase n=1 Tax=Bacillus selenitireducens (strain ATCC 700615 / DSM 15326 / MLS10) TaxID=439292 RepID=D6XYA0_BACIE|nr:bifunctional diguanylate cyclase/phosphodiesterase [Salisediminibacterium selenitireducens]ADI00169.1 diguanylate cyclase/phosphodiesterase [[Bacillus] selenitireducens MLS10]